MLNLARIKSLKNLFHMKYHLLIKSLLSHPLSKILEMFRKSHAVDMSNSDRFLWSYPEYRDYVRSGVREPKIKEYIECRITFDEYL